MRIKRINESVEEMDEEYIRECFIDLFDDDSFDTEILTSEYNFIEIGFDLPFFYDGNNWSKLDDFLPQTLNIILLFEKIYQSLDKVKIAYPKSVIGIKDGFLSRGNSGKKYLTISIRNNYEDKKI